MPPCLGPCWAFFARGEKQNSSHFKAHCLGCVAQHRPATVPQSIDHEAGIDIQNDSNEAWFIDACKKAGSVLGVEDTMVAHILGPRRGKGCPYVSDLAKEAAKRIRFPEEDSNNGEPPRKKQRTAVQAHVESKMFQTVLKTYKSSAMPFTEEQIKVIHQQVVHATTSANLPHIWIDNPEVIELFLLFRSTACDALPSCKVLSNRLMDESSQRVETALDEKLRGNNVTLTTDGWKDNCRNAVSGVNVLVSGQSNLVELVDTNGQAKDGPAMCRSMGRMIDRAEAKYGCIVRKVCTDNDGGTEADRKLLVAERPWLLAGPCWAHQAQLINGDYFKVSNTANDTAETTTDLIGWLLNHNRVRHVFDTAQTEKIGKAALTYLAGNQTRWTTHTLAFHRLLELKESLRGTVILQRNKIIEAQLGAEKNKKKRTAITKAANHWSNTIDDSNFWKNLDTVAADIEPITYMVNINQADTTRPDQVLLSLAGVYLHFAKHADKKIRTGMTKSLEQCWKEVDQAIYFLALVLNPYERLERFGDKANIDIFTVNDELLKLYRRVHSRPPQTVEDELAQAKIQDAKDAVSTAFYDYMTGHGPFASWEKSKHNFAKSHGHDPVAAWRQFRMLPATADLAMFAILVLELLCNQGGNERTFSDLLVKKTKRRNRLGLAKLEKMSKLGAAIRAEHVAANLVKNRTRNVHDDKRVRDLLSVPRYADIIDREDDSDDDSASGKQTVRGHPLGLVASSSAWRIELAKWQAVELGEEQAVNEDDDEEAAADDEQAVANDKEQPAKRSNSQSHKAMFPRSLALLFGSTAARPATAPARGIRKPVHTEEVLLMELLAAEYDGEPPDDGALEGSDDDYDE